MHGLGSDEPAQGLDASQKAADFVLKYVISMKIVGYFASQRLTFSRPDVGIGPPRSYLSC